MSLIPRNRSQNFVSTRNSHVKRDQLLPANLSDAISRIQHLEFELKAARAEASMNQYDVSHRKGSMKDALADLFKTTYGSDVSLLCGGETFHCHKVILSCRCEYFKTLFKNDKFDDVKENVIKIRGIDPEIMRMLLDIVYNDVTARKIKEMPKALELLIAADRFIFPFLKDVCSKIMVRQVNPTNAPWMLRIFLNYNASTRYVNKVKDYILDNIDDIISTKYFVDLVKSYPDIFLEVE